MVGLTMYVFYIFFVFDILTFPQSDKNLPGGHLANRGW
jgi:hypothetical protein